MTVYDLHVLMSILISTWQQRLQSKHVSRGPKLSGEWFLKLSFTW
jgi:hypothetical protein